MPLKINCFTCGKTLPAISIQPPKRYKSKFHWTNYENRSFPKYKALNHFDDFYKSVYGAKLWRSLRLGLLCNNKYCAVVNNYADPENTMQNLESRGALNMRTLFELQYEKQTLEGKQTDEERSKETIQRMEETIDTLIMDSAKGDVLSSIYSRYEKAPDEEEIRQIVDEDEKHKDVTQEYVGKLSLVEGLKDAHIDHSRIIHPKNSVSAATLFEFIPASQIKGLDNWISESEHYEFYKKSTDFPINVEKETYLNFPEHLNVYVYEKCNVTSFPRPKFGSTGVLDYFLLDGGSVLPVLALDLESGDHLLDMCGAPGGKSITAFQTLLPSEVVCNDISLSRVNRIHRVMKEYLYNSSSIGKFSVTHQDALAIRKKDYYNKILVDVPCTNDRVSVNEDENNYFASNRTPERLQLPQLQSEILATALKLVACGGTVVYSTCSLSPVQNEGVVQMALRKLWEESDDEIVVKDLNEALKPGNIVYHLGTNIGLKYGTLVLPHLTANFGPIYVCKLEKVA